MPKVNEFIKLAIDKKGINQQQAAELLGISEMYMSDLVNGKRSVSAFVAVRLQRQFGMRAEMLMVQQVRAELSTAQEEYNRELLRR